VYTVILTQTTSLNNSSVINLLESSLAVAISDPATRFSKAKIQETLKLSLGQEFNLLGVAGVTLSICAKNGCVRPHPTKALSPSQRRPLRLNNTPSLKAPIQSDPSAQPQAPNKPDRSELQA